MPSDSAADADPGRTNARGDVAWLLDAVFGFVVWAAHLLLVYVSTAVACQLGLGSASSRLQSTIVGTLCVVTLIAAAIVVWHAVQRHRQQGRLPDRGFLARIAVGHDAVAAVAILWQLMPLLMVPLCR